MTKKMDALIPEGLHNYAKSRSSTFVTKLREAMTVIEAEIEHNEVLYPFNSGRLTKAELCRRAGVDDKTLQNPTHKSSTNKMVDDWLERVKRHVAQGRTVVRRAVTERAEHWKQEHDRIGNAYALAELEHNERMVELEKLKGENAKLKQDITELREMLGRAEEKNIISIRPKGN